MHYFTTYLDYFFEQLPPPNLHFFYIDARKLNIFWKQFLKYGLNHVKFSDKISYFHMTTSKHVEFAVKKMFRWW